MPRLGAAERRWLIVGVIIRLCLMPFSFHSDLLFMVQHANYIAFHGAYAINTYFYHNYGVTPQDTPLHYYMWAVWLWIIKPLTPTLDSLIFRPPYEFASLVNDPSLFRTLFLVKLPFLAFDLGTAFLLLKTAHKRSSLVFKFWMLNPIAIYVSYVWGGYDILPTFFTLLSLYFAQEKRLASSYLSLGIAAALKLYAFLLLPLLILTFPNRNRTQLKLILFAIVPYLASILPDTINSWPTLLPFNTFSARQSQYVLGMQLNLGMNTSGSIDILYVFILLYGLLVLFQYGNKASRLEDLWKYMLGVLMLYFVTSTFHPQYFLWVVPFVGLAIGSDARYLKPHLLQIICFVAYTFYTGAPAAGMLFIPLSPFLAASMSPYELISAYMPASLLVGAARSIFSAIGVWIIYMTYRSVKSS
jgi:Gpi18-like mannosyltransferase